MSTRSMLGWALLCVSLGCKHNEPARSPGTTGGAAEPAGEPASGAPEARRGTGTEPGNWAPDANKGPIAEAPPVAVARFVEVSCSQATGSRKGLTTTAPEGATCKETADAVVISAGDSFQLVIHDAAPDMAGRKRAIESDGVHRLTRYTTDQPDAIVYETNSGTGQPEYHFYVSKKFDHTQVTCESASSKSYTQAQAEAMVRACQALTKK